MAGLLTGRESTNTNSLDFNQSQSKSDIINQSLNISIKGLYILHTIKYPKMYLRIYEPNQIGKLFGISMAKIYKVV